MPVDLNSSNPQDQSLSLKNKTFEWHITITVEMVEDIADKITAITVLQYYAQQKYSKQKNEQQYAELSNSELKKAISKGALWLTPATNKKQTQRLRRVKKPLNIGDELHFYYNNAVLSTTVPPARLIADLTDYSVWYKPYGMLSQGSKWSDHCTIARFAQLNLPNERPAFIVHRLDKAATGLILIAHTKKAAQALSAMFEHHQLVKIYHIIVHGNHSGRSQPEIIKQEVDQKPARSTFNCLAYDKTLDRSLIQVKIDSGRKHQIRIHAASIGMPVVGDRLHGIADENEVLDLQLCAVSLAFDCPLTGNDNSLEAKPRFFELPEILKPQLT
ncbi:RluA family pseudouridine synthase [Colwellia echini]|uniref:RNA pseudouridine synthase n=1 Tax=Colwellia echini TaxID=1982103 RepID=A0ABY3MYV2_9GAMM|nr:RNA pseudouridine synthase [Colwellia echini]TYK66385.1 RNA pseudouridine synthase [Colwellia echini]